MNPVQNPYFDDLFGWLQRNLLLNPNWIVLEFGVGKHGFATFYAKHFSKVFGLDIYDYAAFHPGIEFLLSDGNNIPLPDESVDLVVSHSVLEHVGDLNQAMTELSRILKVGGFGFLTVSPLYFAATGSHVNHPSKLENWEHLDPSSEYYMLHNPIGGTGDFLNKLTSSKMLAAVGSVPWDVLRYENRYEGKKAPEFTAAVPLAELYTREFRLIAQKRARLTEAGAVAVPAYPYRY